MITGTCYSHELRARLVQCTRARTLRLSLFLRGIEGVATAEGWTGTMRALLDAWKAETGAAMHDARAWESLEELHELGDISLERQPRSMTIRLQELPARREPAAPERPRRRETQFEREMRHRRELEARTRAMLEADAAKRAEVLAEREGGDD